MPDGSKTTLHVVRDQFEEAGASLRLVAPAVAGGGVLRSDLEVLFFFEGNLCGRAIKAILVGDGAAAAPEVIEGSASVSIPDAPAPDLTVMISRGSDETRLQWTFVTPHDVPDVPVESIAHTLKNDSAKSFALDLVRNLSEWDRNALAPAQLLGIGEQISGAMPNEFWLTLDKIWAKKQTNGGGAPSILMVSEDPYVPWELAATTQNYARPERLDNTKPPFLGAQLRVGRWIPPDPTPFGGDIPTLPPRTTAEIDKMVLFVGDYDALVSGQRPLPQAIEEGKKLALRYSAIQREAVLNDVTDLVRDEIVEGGAPVKVDAIHFACHGEVSRNPRHNGIVLSDRAVRLSADMIFGSEIGTRSDPFVFINACQLGIATEQLDGDYGGLAGAFLDKGATGFVSPLWSVDDDIAQEFALDFYKEVYDQDTPAPVAEVMRELRSRFDMDSTSPSASYLAYVYYGHPDLIIDKL
jgi:hypothetical protein